jgi:WD40 repeat protein
MRIFRGHTSGVRGVAYTPDGSILASCGDDGTVRLWELATGRSIARLGPFSSGREIFYDVAISPDGRWLASARRDKRILLWSLPHAATPVVLEGHDWAVTSVAFGADSTLFSAAGAGNGGGELAWWAKLPDDARRISPIEGQGLWSVAVSPTSDLLAVGGSADSEAVHFWDRKAWTPEPIEVGGCRVRSVAFSPDGSLLAHANTGGLAVLWDLDSGRERFNLRGHSDRVTAVAFSPDGSHLATASQDGTVLLWDAESGAERACYDWEMGRLGCVAFAPDGMTIAAGGNRDVVVWDVEA